MALFWIGVNSAEEKPFAITRMFSSNKHTLYALKSPNLSVAAIGEYCAESRYISAFSIVELKSDIIRPYKMTPGQTQLKQSPDSFPPVGHDLVQSVKVIVFRSTRFI